MINAPEISVVMPGYNEAENIHEMLSQVNAVISGTGRTFEIIYVDDGSIDGSAEVLEREKQVFPVLRPLYHRKNFGQSAAILSGIQRAQGELVITMDSDLQNDPADLPAMIETLEREKVDAVCGIRQKRQDDRLKLFSNFIANKVRHWALKDGIADAGCSMRVIRRNALEQLPAFKALHRFLPTILIIHGFKVMEIPICHRARCAGISKYGVGDRLWVGIMDLFGLRWYRIRYLPPGRLRD